MRELQVDGDRCLVVDITLPESSALESLTPTEREIAHGIAQGASNAELARRRGVAVRTVANQVRAVFEKLGVTSRGELVVVLCQGDE